MKYVVRAVKYFLYISVILTLILTILVLCKMISPDINVTFRNGWKSVGLIAAMFAAVSAFYPLFGYSKRLAGVLGDLSDLRDDVVKVMDERGYRIEKEDGDVMTFRYKSLVNRIFRVWEDRVTIEPGLGGFYVEGLTRDITRIVYGLEYRFRNPDEASEEQ